MDDLLYSNDSYERQLAHLKLIIPHLACPQQVNLCSVWIERFTSCDADEEVYRSKLVSLFVRQLREHGRLAEPFLYERNALMPLKNVLLGHNSNNCYETIDTEEDDFRNKVNQSLARFEFHLGQIEASERPIELLEQLRFLDCLDMGAFFNPIMERVQHRWNGIFQNINRRHPTKSITPVESCASSSTCSVASSEHGQCKNICTDPLHLSTNCLSESPNKYKTFALKCAKRMEKMQQEIAKLKQSAQIQASTECIRFDALKSELVQRTGAKQQAEMCAMIDQLDERYREIIAKSMALGVAETKKAKAT